MPSAGARFVDFGGWEMPVQYKTGIQAEHRAVRSHAGLFDVSHMGEIDVRGPDAVAAVNRLITNDPRRSPTGRRFYTCLCRPTGGIVDDLVIYRFSRERVFICCNAANRAKDFAWIVEHLRDATAEDQGDDWAQLALQGPSAVPSCRRSPPRRWPTSSGTGSPRARSRACRPSISRTGYTGEDGFELYLPVAAAAPWDALFAAGSRPPAHRLRRPRK
ncbi:MAG: hypothetical protein R3F60_29275 [bacterium]